MIIIIIDNYLIYDDDDDEYENGWVVNKLCRKLSTISFTHSFIHSLSNSQIIHYFSDSNIISRGMRVTLRLNEIRLVMNIELSVSREPLFILHKFLFLKRILASP